MLNLTYDKAFSNFRCLILQSILLTDVTLPHPELTFNILKMKHLSIFRIKIHGREFIRLVCASIILSALILVISSFPYWRTVIFKFKFYYSLWFHIPMVMIVILYIGLVSFILDQILPWQKGNYLRALAQGLFGLLGAVILAYWLARIYYGIHK